MATVWTERSALAARSRPLFELTRVRILELLREPEALFWVFCFPVLLAIALGIAFREQAPQPVPVGVEAGSAEQARFGALEAAGGVAPVVVDRDRARADLRAGRLALRAHAAGAVDAARAFAPRVALDARFLAQAASSSTISPHASREASALHDLGGGRGPRLSSRWRRLP